MSQKRRGLGRGLGALIPSAPGGDRPVDVFFPGGEKVRPEGQSASAVTTVVAPQSTESAATAERSSDSADGARLSHRTRSWDSAIADGRLKIRTGAEEGRSAEDDSNSSAVDPIAALSGFAAQTEDEADTPDEHQPAPLEVGSVSVDVLDPANIPADPVDVSRETDLLPVPGARFAEIPVPAIHPNAWQPRTVFDESDLDELVESIREIGVLQPIVVRPSKDGGASYELIMGERRWRAAQAAGLETIPAIVRETDDADMLRDALLENLHRAALNPLEEAAAYRQLLDDFGCTHEELATRIARSRPQISNTLRLLKLPPLVQRRVAAGVLSAGHARALLGLTDGAEIERLAQRIVSEGLSVRATEEIVTLMSSEDAQKARRAPRAGQRSVAIDELATRLSDRFETRVKVSLGKSKGRMTVEFASVDDLNRILEVMAPEDPGLLRP